MITASVVLALSALAAQQPPQSAPPPPPDTAAEPSDDIVVAGLKDLDAPDSAVTRRTLGSNKTGPGAVFSRTAFEFSAQFAKCAITRKSDRMLLRQVLDGRVNSARHAFSQARLLKIHATCLPNPQRLIATDNDRSTVSSGAPFDVTYYDRGALFIAALNDFAPNLSLTTAQTGDPAVQARFDAREVSLAQFRLPIDRNYFQIAVCLVRLQPALSVRLVRDTSLAEMERLEAAIVNRGRACVGGARHVYFDGTQFRFYIADAVYRWAVAAQGVDSLVPLD